MLISITVYLNISKTEDDAAATPMTQEEVEEVEQFQATLTQKGGLFDQVGQSLKEKGYEAQILGMIYSKDKVLIKFVLSNKEAIAVEQKEVITIFNELIIKNNFNPKAFQVKVSNDDSPDW